MHNALLKKNIIADIFLLHILYFNLKYKFLTKFLCDIFRRILQRYLIMMQYWLKTFFTIIIFVVFLTIIKYILLNKYSNNKIGNKIVYVHYFKYEAPLWSEC